MFVLLILAHHLFCCISLELLKKWNIICPECTTYAVYSCSMAIKIYFSYRPQNTDLSQSFSHSIGQPNMEGTNDKEDSEQHAEVIDIDLWSPVANL